VELAKAYDPKQVEDRLYASWLADGAFTPTPGEGTPYCITIPPPNITGKLHIGHALNNTVIDTVIRRRRMLGDNTLCLPGTDHAGIATQNVIERALAAEGLSRHDLGREAFLERCWAWRAECGDTILNQFRRLGLSYDWTRTRFTLDESYVAAIYEEFLRWWDRGLVYRGARVVNWCPRCRSAISDIEVASAEEPGNLYHIRYPFADGDGFITVATTRPETLLGDAAVAVNPEDPRYQNRIGAEVSLPLTSRTIRVVADQHARAEFGSGAVKITPAHDLDDFEVGLRHGLHQIVVITEDGTMAPEAGGAYAGLDRFDCRKKALADLEALGLLEKIEPYVVKIPRCDRCKTVLEPLLSEQWFVKQTELAGPAAEAIRSGKVRIVPERYTRIALDWLDNIRDWCISRQLWWGHRIPVWWTEDGRYSAGRSAADAAQRLGVPEEALRQDEDVLDTWFSSALWPHATLGWPADSEDLKFWYPTNVLSTAAEILYLWVARMIMTGIDFLGEVPFHQVYIHATVLDEHGDRMSKSKGNGVDPLEMVDRYGADSLRLSLLQQAGLNQDIKYNEDRVRIAGTFCNKLWNAARFVLTNLEGQDVPPLSEAPAELLTVPDRWILSRLQRTAAEVNAKVEGFELDDAMRSVQVLLWDDFCDWYVEIAKPRLRDGGDEARVARAVLAHCMDGILRLIHPMVPFITEELWQALRQAAPEALAGHAGIGSILVAPYPGGDAALLDPDAERRMAIVMDAVRALRNVRAEALVAPALRVRAAICPAEQLAGESLTDAADLVQHLARLSELWFVDLPPESPGAWVASAATGCDVFVDVGGAVDPAKERAKLQKELAEAEANIARCRAKLENPAFVDRAPAAIVEKERALLADSEEKQAKLSERLAALGA
jgi:valyl-tRNA synthetase